MDEVVAQLLTFQTIILMMAVVICTYFIRKSVELFFPALKKSADEMAPGQTYLSHLAAWWNEVGLHLIPVILGIALVFAVKELASLKFTSKGGMTVYGGVLGWFASTGYKILNRTIKTKWGVELPSTDDSVPPPPAPKSSVLRPVPDVKDEHKDEPPPKEAA